MTGKEFREPRVFDPDDPALALAEKKIGEDMAAPLESGEHATGNPPNRVRGRGASWTGVLVSALGSLFLLAASLWFTQFIAIALARTDAIGWAATGLLALAGLAAFILTVREAVGFFRLGRLAAVRKDMDMAAARGPEAERAAVRRLRPLFAARPEIAWPLARLAEHERDVRDPGELLRLAEREVIVPLDGEARRRIMASAKRVGAVTALSPSGVLSVLFVLYENLGLLRSIAALYGGRPGTLGGLKLARMVLGHIVATSGIALTDDLLGQFLGQDAIRRVSRRLGEGAFNGALTARIGVAAIQVCRPMPFLESRPVRLRDLLPELFRGIRNAPGESAVPRRP